MLNPFTNKNQSKKKKEKISRKSPHVCQASARGDGGKGGKGGIVLQFHQRPYIRETMHSALNL